MTIDVNQAQVMLDKGQSVRDVARHFRVVPNAIYKKLRAGRLTKPNAPVGRGKIDKFAVFGLLQSGGKLKDIAALVGCDKSYIYQLQDSDEYAAYRQQAAVPAADQAQPAHAPVRIPPPGPPQNSRRKSDALPDLPQGYIADLIATKGKYLALEVWHKKFGPIIGRDIGAAKAMQEWHRYRGAL